MRVLDNLIYRAEKFNEAKAQYNLGIIYIYNPLYYALSSVNFLIDD